MKHICEVSGAEFEVKDSNNIAMNLLNERIKNLTYKIEKLKEHMEEIGEQGNRYQVQIDMMEYGYLELLQIRELLKQKMK